MDDTIYRQAAIDAVLDRMNVEKHGRNAKPEEIQWALEKLPSAQPENIKCKDCGHAEERGCVLFCGFWTRYTAHKGYCFKAERREE